MFIVPSANRSLSVLLVNNGKKYRVGLIGLLTAVGRSGPVAGEEPLERRQIATK